MARPLHRFWANDRALSLLLGLLVVFIFFVFPLDRLGYDVRVLASAMFTLILLSGAAAVVRSTTGGAIVGVVALLAAALHWSRFFEFGAHWDGLEAIGTTLSSGLLAGIVLVQTLRAGPITVQRIQGAIAAYLLIGMTFGAAYVMVAVYAPGAFTGAIAGAGTPYEEFTYFSFVTLTTVGYGDITPVQPFARSLAQLEALIGQLFPAVLLARLVSMELVYRRAGRPDATDDRR